MLFYVPGGKIPHFCCQMLKLFDFKEAEFEAQLENTEADELLIREMIRNKLAFYLFA